MKFGKEIERGELRKGSEEGSEERGEWIEGERGGDKEGGMEDERRERGGGE